MDLDQCAVVKAYNLYYAIDYLKKNLNRQFKIEDVHLATKEGWETIKYDKWKDMVFHGYFMEKECSLKIVPTGALANWSKTYV